MGEGLLRDWPNTRFLLLRQWPFEAAIARRIRATMQAGEEFSMARLMTSGTMLTPPCENEEFENQMARLRAGDDEIATAVFRRFVRRLIALASRRFESWDARPG